MIIIGKPALGYGGYYQWCSMQPMEALARHVVIEWIDRSLLPHMPFVSEDALEDIVNAACGSLDDEL